MMDVIFIFFWQLIMQLSRKQHSVFFLGNHVGFQCNVSLVFIKSDTDHVAYSVEGNALQVTRVT